MVNLIYSVCAVHHPIPVTYFFFVTFKSSS